MDNVIVPVDFTSTAVHAARYAAKQLVGHYGVTMMLYNSYTDAADAENAEVNLKQLMEELISDHIVKIEYVHEKQADFVTGLEKYAKKINADLIIMGITGRSSLAQVFYESNTLKIAERKICPVLIVPENAPLKELSQVMLTSDFKNIENGNSNQSIINFLSAFKPKLHIVNVDKDHYISLSGKYEEQKQEISRIFSNFNPEFYFMRLYDIDDAIRMFAEEMKIDLIIVVHKSHTFIEKLLKGSHTKTITYHSKNPILVMHE